MVRLSAEGEIVAEYPVPARCPTMCAFGGDDLKTLYVTSARHGRPAEELEAYPQSGNIFAMRVDVPGCPEPLFAG
ncbi:SMP-30/gluconolaconase/LRE-like region [Halomonas elongata]|uniref:SMP-30/gluconolaconase/LRE-like region n=1 Tax=Halomonas elongata TaxID=2746 RepID=A0A1B8P0U0_HALEL|nr:SMP-30/gluconolaconase/LRE-like region [Halomonas elongata]